MTHTATHSTCTPVARGHNRPSLMSLLTLWRSRQALARLDATQLQDIGLTAKEAKAEADRLPWDVPAHWKN